MARDRHDAALQVRGEIAGIAVGGDHDVAGEDFAAFGLDPPGSAGLADGADSGLGAHRYAAAPAGVEQAFVIEGRMQFSRALDDHAAEIIVAGDFPALLLARHHIGARLRRGVEQRQTVGLRGEVLPRPGADKAAGLFPKAIDIFLGDQAVNEAEGVGGVGQAAVRLGPWRQRMSGR